MPDEETGDSLLERLPHAGPARLPDTVHVAEPGRVVASRTLRADDLWMNDEGCFPAVLMIEMMAQVGGLVFEAGEGESHGLLAGVRSLHIHDTVRTGETLTIDCRLIRRMGNLVMVEATGFKEGKDIAHGVIQIGLRPA